MSGPRTNPLAFGGTTSQATYAGVGFLLTALKMGLDRMVATYAFQRPWTPLNYAITGEIGGLFSLDGDDQRFYATMLAIATPFIAVGLVMTVRRLRDVGWPLWLTALFFTPPPINVVFFLILCLVPSRSRGESGPIADSVVDPPDLLVIKDVPNRPRKGLNFGRALLCVLLPLPVAAAVIYLGTNVLRDYGWGLFVGLPFVLPMISVVLYGFGRDVSASDCMGVCWLWIGVVVLSLLLTAFEGLICIVMILPLAIPVALLGAMVGYFLVRLGPRDLGKVVILLFALLPAMIGAEHLAETEPLRFTCETSVVVDAPPEVVWRHVVSFSDLDPPRDWTFRTGLAYPIRARIEGTGVGAVRRCEFSTGACVEPIEVWDEPRLLRFSVTRNPPPMREWNPLFDVDPPHLHGFLVSKHGQFELIPLPGGRTLLRGNTLYQHGLWPATYWRLWSDPIIHRIHDRVLRHIKRLSEADKV